MFYVIILCEDISYLFAALLIMCVALTARPMMNGRRVGRRTRTQPFTPVEEHDA